MKLSEAKQSEKICSFLFTFIGSENLERKEAEKKIFCFQNQNTCETDFLLLRSGNFLKRNWRTLPLSLAETVIGCKD
jgi:hypothetical protein